MVTITIKTKLPVFILFFTVLAFTYPVRAQVTIGSGNPPAKGALLDLKENEAPGGDITSTKGIIFPRVNLTDLASLVPLLSAADATDATQKTTHRGIIVYNIAVSESAKLTEGLYCWDGTKWVKILGNGKDAWLTTGNAGTDSLKNFLGTTDNKPMTFKVNNIRAGYLSSTDGFTNYTSFGLKALSGNNTGEANNAFGYQALLNNTTGAGNSAFGLNALAANTTGGNNTAIGNRALANSTGESNTALGSTALTQNTTGSGNTALGFIALSANRTGGDNTAVGVRALIGNTTSGGNVAVGSNAMAENIAGGDNTALGTYSLSLLGSNNNPAGSRNTAVGISAGRLMTRGSNNIFIGANANVKDSTDNQMNIGGTIFGTGMNGTLAAPAGSIGIRTSTPSSTLTVNGSYAGKYSYINGPYTVTESDYNIILGRSGAGNSRYTVTLPAKSAGTGGTFPGREYHFKNISETDTMVVTVGNTSTERIRFGSAGLNDAISRIVPPGAYARVVSADWPYSTSLFPAWDWFYTTNMTQSWTTSGNAGTNVTNNFLGTSDNNALSIRTNNKERIRIANDVYSGSIPNQAANGGVGITSAATSGTLQPSSSLQVDGSFAGRYVSTNTDYTILHTDYNIVLERTSGNTTPHVFNFTLPAQVDGALIFKGREYYIKNTSDIDTINIVTGNNTESIRYGTSAGNTLSRKLAPGSFVRVVYNGRTHGTAQSPVATWDWDFVGTVTAENVKAMAYTKTVISPINTDNGTNNIATLGNLSVIYDGRTSPGYVQIRPNVQTHYSFVFQKSGTGAGSVTYYGQNQNGDPANSWNPLNWAAANPTTASDNPANFNVNNRDFGVLIVALHNTREVFRCTFNANGALGANGNIPAAPSAVTIFIERLQ